MLLLRGIMTKIPPCQHSHSHRFRRSLCHARHPRAKTQVQCLLHCMEQFLEAHLNSGTASEVSATAQANQVPLQPCSVAAAASNSGAMEMEPARVSGAVFSSAMYAGKRPSQTSDKQRRHVRSSPLPMPDWSQSQRASTASSHSALPGDSKDGVQAADQAFANTARSQACHAGRDLPAAPDATSINVCHESAQGCFSEQPAGPHSAPPQDSSPLVGQMQSEQEAQISQPNQEHFDAHSWDFVQTQQGSIQTIATLLPSLKPSRRSTQRS